eukprot:gnl/TRDRNA2_/TRDRNA2_157988_c3_seq1.p2 gnl/TRDRNA2_/TRDRNA2_157988_c3~~gnl/TRDRNA2_/TRDRNA2_157988_c3_seq1.p2  ORF type:complete len:121 (+),score=7.60 gnl/TRDRNA2_/TRDRNA2_157988_c3_seq1:363-725(+)
MGVLGTTKLLLLLVPPKPPSVAAVSVRYFSRAPGGGDQVLVCCCCLLDIVGDGRGDAEAMCTRLMSCVNNALTGDGEGTRLGRGEAVGAVRDEVGAGEGFSATATPGAIAIGIISDVSEW